MEMSILLKQNFEGWNLTVSMVPFVVKQLKAGGSKGVHQSFTGIEISRVHSLFHNPANL